MPDQPNRSRGILPNAAFLVQKPLSQLSRRGAAEVAERCDIKPGVPMRESSEPFRGNLFGPSDLTGGCTTKVREHSMRTGQRVRSIVRGFDGIAERTLPPGENPHTNTLVCAAKRRPIFSCGKSAVRWWRETIARRVIAKTSTSRVEARCALFHCSKDPHDTGCEDCSTGSGSAQAVGDRGRGAKPPAAHPTFVPIEIRHRECIL